MVVVVGIVSAVIALAVPGIQDWGRNQRLKSAARSLTDAFQLARSEAIRTGNNHIVFLSAGGGTDPAGAALQDPAGTPVPILILDDGQPGSANQNCRIDAVELSQVVYAEQGVNWGVSFATTSAPEEGAAAIPGSGVSFRAPSGALTNWVLFRPDGIPVGFSPACNLGGVGSGGGAVYVTNGSRDYVVTLTPLGGTRVHGWMPEVGGWSQ